MRYFFCFLLLILTNSVYGQTGPAGVGSADGSSSLELWISSDFGVERVSSVSSAVNDSVSIWLDRSGNNNNLTTTSTFSGGELVSNLGFNCVYFDNDVDRGLSSLLSGSGFSNLSMIAVWAVDATAATCRPVGIGNKEAPGGVTADNFQHAGNNRITKDNGSLVQTIAGVANTITIRSSVMSDSIKDWVNGAINIVDTNPFTTSDGEFHLGTKTVTVNDSWVYEAIFFSEEIDTAQRIIIENYLAGKYGRTLSANDIYDQDDPGNGDYDFEIAGIGRIKSTDQNTDAQGSGIIRILNPSNLDDDEFLIWGHDNESIEATETTDVPAGVESRLERVWRVSESNAAGTSIDVGSIEMRWDLNQFLPSVASDLVLLIDSDNDGVFNDESLIGGATDLGGGIFSFTGVTGISDNIRFTLGTIDTLQTPLPVTNNLFQIRAKSENNQINLEAFFESDALKSLQFQKSSDLSNWLQASQEFTIDNKQSNHVFFASDEEPFYGTSYYRIRFVGTDQKEVFSNAVSVYHRKELKVFPNPFSRLIYLPESKQLNVFNLLHQDITEEVEQAFNDDQLELDFKGLPSGLYTIKTENNVYRVKKH